MMDSAGPGLPRDDGREVEDRLMTALFAEPGRDPQTVLAGVTLPGCRYHVVNAVLRDSRFGPPVVGPSQDATFRLIGRWMLRCDGERHARLRSHFGRVFTPRRAEAFRALIAQRANALLDAVAPVGAMDLVSSFAHPLPFSIVATVLGIPEDRHAWLSERMETLSRGIAHQRERHAVERANLAVDEMLAYIASLLEARTTEPADDLLSLLAGSAIGADERDDIIANCIFFVFAGHQTTTSLLTAGTLLLLEHREQLEQLLDSPALWPTAVEEILRYVSPVTLTGTQVFADAPVEGYRFTAGINRLLIYAAANRDPEVFPAPDRFDIHRTPNLHLAFSAGPHYCLGAPLARLHGEVGLAALFGRLPTLRLAGDPVWRGSVPLRTIETCPVAW